MSELRVSDWCIDRNIASMEGRSAGLPVLPPALELLLDLRDARARIAELERLGDAMNNAVRAVLSEPYGCAWCDSGTLRKPGIPGKDHDDKCPYLLLRSARAAWEQRR